MSMEEQICNAAALINEAVFDNGKQCKARFGDELVDVIADGEVVSRGQTVVVVAVHGNRVVVRSSGSTA